MINLGSVRLWMTPIFPDLPALKFDMRLVYDRLRARFKPQMRDSWLKPLKN